MDPADILPLVETLGESVDALAETLQTPGDGLQEMASKLPLLDKAKLYVLMTYAVESILFCETDPEPEPEHDPGAGTGAGAGAATLRLNGVDAKEHQVYKELARVRNYFEKLKAIEMPAQKPQQSLNKEAAIRFIRSDLAEDKEINLKLTEMIAKERAKAALKTSKLGQKRRLDAAAPEEKSSEETESKSADSVDESTEEAKQGTEPQPKKKKPKQEKREKPEGKEEERKGGHEKRLKKKKKNKKSTKD
ncbi:Sas10/Utp3/C1D family-domain-containing protein [Nemania abortiva]|nr:Sas10/Utp3/C1D family-domain-containing protein [Nemania abortiva]